MNLTLFGLAGFFFGTVLHIFLISVIRGRLHNRWLERALLALLGGLLVWYLGNLLGLILRQMDLERVAVALVWIDVAAFSGLSVLPALLLHTHWLYYAQYFEPRSWERRAAAVLLAALYLPLLALPLALSQLASSPAQLPLTRLGEPYRTGFLLLLALAYGGSAVVQGRILKRSTMGVERQLFGRLLPFFIAIPALNFVVFGWAPEGSVEAGSLAVLVAQMASLAPTLVVTYYIYRYRFLEITVRRSIASALVILITLAFYLAGIRTLADYLVGEFAAPRLLIEGVLLAAVLLFFNPLGRWMEDWVGRLFRGELRRYRELGDRIRRNSARILSLPELKAFIERELVDELPVSSVHVHLEQKPAGVPPQALFPLRSGARELGYLEVHLLEERYGAGHREALQLLAGEVAAGLERSRFLEAQVRMERELAEKSRLEELGRTAARIAHRVKNPLSSMKTLLQLRAERSTDDPEQLQEIRMMIGEIDRLSKTVTKLLSFSRLETAPSDTPQPVDPEEFLLSLQEVFAGDLRARRLNLRIAVGADVEPLQQHLDTLNEILSNLLSNAIEASPSGTTITLAAKMAGELVELSVEDQGRGIPESVRDRLFDSFVTTKSVGTGLGLAIVRRRVEQLGGTIDVEEGAAGEGTRFALRVPAVALQQDPDQDSGSGEGKSDEDSDR